MQQEYIIELLLFRFVQGEATQEEKAVIRSWADADPSHKEVFRRLIEEAKLKEDLKDLFHLVDDKSGTQRLKRMSAQIQRKCYKRDNALRLKGWLPYVAACLLIGIGISSFFLLGPSTISVVLEENSLPSAEIVKAGTNKAVLTTDYGASIELRDDNKGLIVADGDVIYSDGQKIVGNTNKRQILNLHTPRGGQYKVILPDGTKVYLNAESSLRYPNYFDNSKRIVELEGEAYFEVKKDGVPFIVKSDLQEIEVLGTSFNVSAYADDLRVQTTLVEGKVRIKNHGKESELIPGQQLIVTENKSRVRRVDTDVYTAWKDGAFSFSDESLEGIMMRVSRWYDVQIVFVDNRLKQRRFEGYVSRFSDMNVLLNTLELPGEVKFTVQDRIVFVQNR